MKQRKIMEENLLYIVNEANYKSERVEEEVGGDPVNPFMKRVFEKKMRRSSVASENMNPNVSISKEDFVDPEILSQLDSIFKKGTNYLMSLKTNTINEIVNLQNTEKGEMKSKEVINNLEKSMDVMISYLESSNQTITKKVVRSNSIGRIDQYQSESIEYAEKNKVRTKGKGEQSSRRMASSAISSNGKTQTKSIYESVLEERRNKKNRNSRIV